MDRKKIIFVILITTSTVFAVDENFYMGGQSYYNFGSSYYPKYTNDYYWGGDGWIFKTGYKAPTERCCRRVKCTRACTSLRSDTGASAGRHWCRSCPKSICSSFISNKRSELKNKNCVCNCNGACRP